MIGSDQARRFSEPADDCCTMLAAPAVDPRYRRALWIALAINGAMFVVEIGAGMQAQSVSLLADAIDFFGDAVNYGLSLAVLAGASIWRARTALLKALSMGAFGIFVLGKAAYNAFVGVAPEPLTMGAIGFVALAANVGVGLLLYAWRDGDANMRAVWLCTRNDALGNVAVLFAAAGVFGTGGAWPDLVVAAIISTLALGSAVTVARAARGELRRAAPQ